MFVCACVCTRATLRCRSGTKKVCVCVRNYTTAVDTTSTQVYNTRQQCATVYKHLQERMQAQYTQHLQTHTKLDTTICESIHEYVYIYTYICIYTKKNTRTLQQHPTHVHTSKSARLCGFRANPNRTMCAQCAHPSGCTILHPFGCRIAHPAGEMRG